MVGVVTLTSTITTVVSVLPIFLFKSNQSVSFEILKTKAKTKFFLGSFVVQKKRPEDPGIYIHSKPVVYTNNGGGRDTYISQNDGGFRPMHRAGYGKNTFYNNLRQYPLNTKPFTDRKKSHTATFFEKKDDFSSSQDHFNHKFKREMQLVQNY